MTLEACSGTAGRRYEERDEILARDPFLVDYGRILQSKAYRRLAYKAQVITSPDHPHVRTRLVHTGEVIDLSISIAESLGLNIHLCMAIAIGHDLGHTPYGHRGENVLTKCAGKPFKHYVNSVVLAQHIERKGRGLNLTYETLEGILNHSRHGGEMTMEKGMLPEYAVVMYADKIAYTFSDLNDALRYGLLKTNQLPLSAIFFGGLETEKDYQRKATSTVLQALISESREKGVVQFSEGRVFENFKELRQFMYDELYLPLDLSLQELTLEKLYEYASQEPEFEGIDPAILISLMTDREAANFGQLLLRVKTPTVEQLRALNFGIFEIIDHLKGKDIDYTDPDLEWGRSFTKPSNG